MPTSSSTPQLKPAGFLALLFAAAVLVLLPFVYLAFLAGTGWLLIWQGNLSVDDYVLNRGPAWWAATRMSATGIGLVAWLALFKPLISRRPKMPAGLELKPASQPDLHQVVAAICQMTGGRMPVVWQADCSMGVRVTVQGALLGWLAQRQALRIGLPLAATSTAREFAGSIAHEVGRYPAGMYGRLLHLIRAVNEWLDWAACRQDPWRESLATAAEKSKKKRNILLKLTHGFLWLTQRPIWVFRAVARAVSAGPMRRSVLHGDRCQAAFSGSQPLAEWLQRQAHLRAAWEQACASVQLGLVSQRLPDNFPQTVTRHASNAQATIEALQRWEAGTAFVPSASVRGKRALDQSATGVFAVQGNGAILIRDFNEIARQATQLHYQHDLGLDVVRFRLVAADETVGQKRRIQNSLEPVRRYFQGLVHPERGLCAAGGGTAIRPDAEAFRVAILDGRVWMHNRGDQMRATLREWTMAWQRIRDLEMAHAFALAGLPVDSHQYGVSAHSAELYREEIDRQSMVMEVSEDPLLENEMQLETRFAAALGLLWLSPDNDLPEGLRQLKTMVPDQVALYQVLVDRLPPLRSLITVSGAYAALGAQFAGADSKTALLPALRFIVPQMMLHCQRMLTGLQHLPCPANVGAKSASVAHHLLGKPPPQSMALLAIDWEHAPLINISHEEATRAGELVPPIMDRFVALYHSVLAWLVSAAETAEMHLVDFAGHAADEPETIAAVTASVAAPFSPSPALA